MTDHKARGPLVELAGDNGAERLDRRADAGKVVLLGLRTARGIACSGMYSIRRSVMMPSR
ncbi:hypothetical protein [Nonomuraea jabiensis]|uniref:hypothetical protein n=1 Tax=Nonomuraea jabiensis TaxID=882448 RepID=UPI003D76007C